MELWRWTIPALYLMIVAATASQSSDLSPLVVLEQQGNSSLECIASGRCLSCSFAEKQNEEIYHCSLTGYYMTYNCVEVDQNNNRSSSSTSTTKSKQGSIQKKLQRKTLETSENKKIYHINRSCMPYVAEDRLSVLGFEGIMLGMLAVFSPVLYVRKKRGFVPSGMTRISTNTRF